jgi:hypothetical protein
MGCVVDEAVHGHFRGGEVVGLNPNIRIYRYRPGQFFDAHCKLQHRPV